MMPDKTTTATYLNVQVLRGIAALLVVAHHVFILLKERGIDITHDWVSGAAGVDIFFPISGFVMVLTTYSGWGVVGGNRHFFLKRLIRIAPLYWLLTTVKLLLLFSFPALALRGTVEVWHSVASYLFLPAANVADGHSHPILPTGWTLNLEMFFYALFGLTLIAGKNPLRWMVPILLGVGFVGALHLDLWKPIQFYANPITIEFALGMIIGWLAIQGFRLSLLASCGVLLVSSCALVGAEYIPGFSPNWRLCAWGVPGALMLLAMISLEGRLNRLPFYRTACLAGDASYSIYLSHGFILPGVGIVCHRLGYTGLYASIAVIAACLVLSVVCGVWIHRRLEIPLNRFFRAHFLPDAKVSGTRGFPLPREQLVTSPKAKVAP
jgi:exopolysaccharide production protein ExoZ